MARRSAILIGVAVAGAGGFPRRAVLLLAALLVLAVVFASRAEAFVYWASANQIGSIGRANLNGTGADRDFIFGAKAPDGMAVNATHLFWANQDGGTIAGTIGRSNLNGTGVDQDFVTGANGASGVAVNATHVFWSNFLGDTIGRANLNGTGVDQSFITAPDPGGMAVNATHLFWTNRNGAIARANLNGAVDAAHLKFIPLVPGPTGVAVNGTHVFWTNRGTDTIGRANLNGTGVNESFITGANDPSGVAVNATHVFWANNGADTIGRANLNGTGIDQGLILGADNPSGVAVDSLPLPSPPPPDDGAPPPDDGTPPGVPPEEGGPPNDFSFGKVKRNKRKGTAKLTVKVPGSGELDLAKTKKVKPDDESAEDAGKEKLAIKPKGKAKKKLNRNGKAKVRANVTYTPDGGSPNTESKKIKLVKR